jgi:hypothetical protein
MDFGIVANASAVADAFELARACQDAFAQLTRAVRRAGSAGCAPRTRRPPRLNP